MKYHYVICNQPDEVLFRKQCAALEHHLPGLEKEALLTDVDGSQIQCYRFHGRELVVKNSYYLQELTVDAQEDLEGWFQKKEKSPDML